jgi:SAM-dependent methyltransferase
MHLAAQNYSQLRLTVKRVRTLLRAERQGQLPMTDSNQSRAPAGLIARWRGVIARMTGRGVYPHEFAALLLNPLRRFVQFSPLELWNRLGTSERARILELGPGPGYFSVTVARKLTLGRLELCDLQPEMLQRARRRLARAGIRNAGFACADGRALPYRAGAFDGVFLVTVIGEVPDPPACLRELRRVMRAGAVLSISETRTDPDFVALAELRAIAQEAGFTFSRSFGTERNYTANFTARG